MFRTPIEPVQPTIAVSHQSKILLMGSCFADEIGQSLCNYKFNTLSNPFGTIYNPVSMGNLLNPAYLFNQHLAEWQGTWFSLDAHSELFGATKDQLLERLAQRKQQTLQYLSEASLLVLTLGTAWVYVQNQTQEIVANCHKLPASLFTKRLLQPDEITASFEKTYLRLRKINPGLRILLTVSPVRHTKDTLVLNSVSKSVLRLAAHTLSERYPEVSYFPAFEILNDDLRDYRFYKPDMIHPNEVALEYIWDIFCHTYMNGPTRDFIKQWDKIRKALAHNPFHTHPNAQEQFLLDLKDKLDTFKEVVDIGPEYRYIEDRLQKLRIQIKN